MVDAPWTRHLAKGNPRQRATSCAHDNQENVEDQGECDVSKEHNDEKDHEVDKDDDDEDQKIKIDMKVMKEDERT